MKKLQKVLSLAGFALTCLSAMAIDSDLDGIVDQFDPFPNDITRPGFQPLYEIDNAGSMVSAAGDVDADGYDDFVVGKYGITGYVRIYSGLTGSLIHEFEGNHGDYFGRSVGAAGDVNNDGYADVIAGGYSSTDGHVRVISGADGSLLYDLTDGGPSDYYGHAVSGVGDINKDNYDDFLVGTYRSDSAQPGEAWLYSGQDGTLLHVFGGFTNADYFGRSVSGAGDVNQDGYPDLVIGAYRFGQGSSRAFVYSGQDYSLLFALDNDVWFFPGSLNGAGDINNDGYPDLIASNPDVNYDYCCSSGRVNVYSGYDGSILYDLHREFNQLDFGQGVAGVGDVNGDNYDDFAISHYINLNDYAPGMGMVQIYSGKDASILFSFYGTHEDRVMLGRSVAGAGDVDGDGYADIIAGFSGSFVNSNGGLDGFSVFGGSLLLQWIQDADSDSIIDAVDNCIHTANTDQSDLDGDNTGDVCDGTIYGDLDNDGYDDLIVDNCPHLPNPDQLDTDSDGVGDVCDADQGGQEIVMSPGTRVYAKDQDVIVRVMDAEAGYTSELWLTSPGPAQLIATNRDVDTVVNLGKFNDGEELIFSIYIQETGYTYATGPASRNPDNELHAAVYSPQIGVAVVGFEDLYGGGDQDFNDNVFRFYGLSDSYADTDNDGISNYLDDDDDNDGVLDINDAFPQDELEWSDNDNDGLGDNADTDDDNDGVIDDIDTHPLDTTRWLADTGILYNFYGDYENLRLGEQVSLGDVNNDGYSDIAVEGQYSFVYSGLDGSVLKAFFGGYRFHTVGDINADGYEDLLRSYNNNDERSVEIISGAGYSILYQYAGSTYATSTSHNFGTIASAAAGDVNNDGYDDFIIGNPSNDRTGYGSNDNTGAAYVFSGADGSLLYTFDGAAAGVELGDVVSGAGDVNGDGYDDVLIGHDNTLEIKIISGADGTELYTVIKNHWSLAPVGDINIDGYDDFIVGDMQDDLLGPNTGSATVYSGVDGQELFTLYGGDVIDYFGMSVSGAGDVNADGYPDIIVGSASENLYEVIYGSVGTARVFSGYDRALLYVFAGDDYNDRLGEVVSGGGDVNGDGYDDLVVGGSYVDDYGYRSGLARVYSGAALWTDSDSDGLNDSIDGNDDNDGLMDIIDFMPQIFTAIDTDNDGIDDSIDWDDDNDGVPDVVDATPQDSSDTSEVNLPADGSYRGVLDSRQILR